MVCCARIGRERGWEVRRGLSWSLKLGLEVALTKPWHDLNSRPDCTVAFAAFAVAELRWAFWVVHVQRTRARRGAQAVQHWRTRACLGGWLEVAELCGA